MPTAGAVATELRRIADALDADPEAEICKLSLWSHNDSKNEFLNFAHLMPRPYEKSVWTPGTIPYLQLVRSSDVVEIDAVIDQHKVCRIVKPAQPAEYECEPLLSAEEEAQLA